MRKSFAISDVNSTLVIIPARGSSKRIPHKNIKLIAGWPLCVPPGIFKAEQVLISTDNDAIVEVVNQYRLKVPLKSPDEWFDDYARNIEIASMRCTVMNFVAPLCM